MSKKILILGAGRMGSIIASELSKDYEISIADIKMPSQELWEQGVRFIKADLDSYDKIKEIVKDFDLVVGALPAAISLRTMYAVIESGKSMVDVSYMTENPLSWNDFAVKMKSTVLVDTGLAPGLTNLVVGKILNEDRNIVSGKLMVGGVAKNKNMPYGYRLTWSPQDLLEEYTRKARYINNKTIVESEALSNLEEVFIPEIGLMEAFLTDGLRTLLYLDNVENLIEKTLRWPGHIKSIKPLIESDTFLEEMQSKCNKGKDLSVFYCEINNKVFRAIIKPDKELTSMQKSTALTVVCFVKLFLEASDLQYGVFAPEHIGMNEDYYNFIIKNLSKYNVNIIEEQKRNF